MRATTLLVVPLAAAVLTVASCSSATTEEAQAPPAASSTSSTPASSTPADTSSAAAPSPAATVPGAYLTKAEYEDQMADRSGTAVVLFFHASWCPDCQATETAINESGVPDGLTVVKVDYDSETDLRRDYGVTQQHTFVQVGSDGAEIKKWTGSADGAAILAETT